MTKLLPHSQLARPGWQNPTRRLAAGLASLALTLFCLPPAARGQVIYSDSFTNSGTITPWIAEEGNWTETGGQMVGGINPTSSYGFAYVTNSASNYTMQAQIHFSTTSAYGGGVGGYLNPSTGAHYAAWVYPEASSAVGLPDVPLQDVLVLIKFQSWSSFGYQGTNFATMATASLAGFGGVGTNVHTVKLGFLGSQITVSYDGNQVINTNDTEAQPYTNGAVSLDFWTDPTTYNFYVDNVQMAAQSTTPVAVNDSYNAVSGRLLSVSAPGVLANDTGGIAPLSAILVTSPSHGAFSFSTNGGFTYTASSNFNGTDSFTYEATDGHTNSSAATVTLNVTADQPPVANNNSYSVQANNALTVAAPGVLANAVETNGFSLTAVLATGPTNGVLTLNTNGGFTYTPGTNFSGTDSFTYYANDGVLNSASPATATITVLPATTLLFDTFSGSLSPWVVESGNWAVTGGQLVNGVNADDSYGYAYLTNIWTNYSVQAQIQFSTTNGWGGGIGGRLNASTGAHYGAWVYPGGSPGGSNILKLIKFQTWTSFGYNTTNGATMQTVSLPAVGTGVHTLKMAFFGSQIAVYYDGAEMISMADTDTGGSPYLMGGVTADNYTDVVGYNLSYADFIISSLANDNFYNVNEDTALTVSAPGVLGNDTDGFGTNLIASQVTGPADGLLTLNTNGGFTYTPNNGFLGQDSFTYQAIDGTNNLGTATVYLNVSFLGASQVFAQNFDSTIAPALPSGWTTSSSGAQSNWVTTDATNQTAPNSVFAPDPTAVGLTSLTSPAITLPVGAAQLSFRNDYNLENDTSNSAIGFDGGTLEIKIGTNAFTDIISAGGIFVSNGYNSVISTQYGSPIAGEPAWSGISGGFVNTVVDLPESASGQTIQLMWVCATDEGNGPGNWTGWYIDTITLSSCASFSCWNLAPTLPTQSALTNSELSLLTVTNTATELNNNATTTGYTLVSPPAGATISTNGIIAWTPSQAQSHTSFTITTVVTNSDPSDSVNPHLTATNSFTVFVKEVNIAPSLPTQSNRVSAGLATVTVTNTATNANIHATNSGYVLTSAPAGASISTNGVITWTPTVSQVPSTNLFTTVVTNTDSFDLVNPHLTATNSFTVTINAVHNGPSLPAQNSRTNNELVLLTVTNTAIDTDVPALTLTYSLLAPTPTNASITTNGIITWTPSQSQSPGTYTISTLVTDNGSPNLSASNSFTVVVKEVNVAPVLPAQSTVTNNELTLLTVTNTASNSNIHATNIGYALVSAPAGATINSNGIITWTPGQNQSPSTNTLTTVVTNSDAFDTVNPHLTATNSFTVVVKEVNVAPVLPAQSNLVTAGLAGVIVTNTASEANIHATIAGYGLVGAPAGATISTNGIITWTPTGSQVPSTNLFTTVVTNSDPFDTVNPQLTATNSFTVTVNAIHNGPSLPSQNNLTDNELVPLTVTNTAIDTDVPALTLTYSLVAPSPVNASISTNGIITWTPSQSQSPGTYTISTLVTDNGSPNLSASNSFTVTVKEVNVAPVLSVQSNLTVNELTPLTVTNTASEANIHATITGYGLIGAPVGASISATGVITWTPGQNESPSTNLFTTVVTNSDPYDLMNPQLTATNSFTVVVKEVNVAPSLPAQSNLTVNELTPLTVTNTASEVNIHATITGYALVNPPAGAIISTNGIITWIPGQNESPGTNTITTVVTNSDPFDTINPRLTATNSFTVVVKEVNVAPSLPSQSNVSKNELSPLTVTNTAMEPNIHSVTTGYGLLNAPSGASIDTNGVITWTPGQNQSPGTYTLTTVVSNGNPYDLVNPSLTATNSFSVTVDEVNVAPELATVPPQTVNELTTLVVTNAAGEPNIHSVTTGYALLSPPAGATVNGSGVITWTPGQNQSPGTYTLMTVASNSNPYDLVNPVLTATNSFNVTVDEVNMAPVLPGQSNVSLDENTPLIVTNAATEPNIHSVTIGYALVNPPAGAGIDSNGVITWTPGTNQGPGTSVITTVVTNNNPYDLVNQQLTATNSFNAIVTLPVGFPKILSVSVTNGIATVTWTTVPGHSYTLQYTDSIGDNDTDDWTNVLPSVMASGSQASMTNAVSGSAQRLYQVVTQPNHHH